MQDKIQQYQNRKEGIKEKSTRIQVEESYSNYKSQMTSVIVFFGFIWITTLPLAFVAGNQLDSFLKIFEKEKIENPLTKKDHEQSTEYWDKGVFGTIEMDKLRVNTLEVTEKVITNDKSEADSIRTNRFKNYNHPMYSNPNYPGNSGP